MTWVTSSNVSVSNAYVTVETLKAKYIYKGVQLMVTPYKTASDRDNGKDPLQTPIRVFIGENDADYATYFAETVVDDAGKTDTKQGYILTGTLDGTQTTGAYLSLAGQDFTAATSD